MHRDRGRAEALEALEHELGVDFRIYGTINLFEAEANQIVEIALTDDGAARRPSRDSDLLAACVEMCPHHQEGLGTGHDLLIFAHNSMISRV